MSTNHTFFFEITLHTKWLFKNDHYLVFKQTFRNQIFCLNCSGNKVFNCKAKNNFKF